VVRSLFQLLGNVQQVAHVGATNTARLSFDLFVRSLAVHDAVDDLRL
jgi:hypothetical protein